MQAKSRHGVVALFVGAVLVACAAAFCYSSRTNSTDAGTGYGGQYLPPGKATDQAEETLQGGTGYGGLYVPPGKADDKAEDDKAEKEKANSSKGSGSS